MSQDMKGERKIGLLNGLKIGHVQRQEILGNLDFAHQNILNTNQIYTMLIISISGQFACSKVQE